MRFAFPETWPPLLLAFIVAPLLALAVLALAHRVLERLLRGRDAPVLLALLRLLPEWRRHLYGHEVP